MKLIHCADIHLDSRMETHLSAEKASKRNTEIIRTFLRLTEYAKENHVRAVIIAGDLFDGERVKQRTVEEIMEAMDATPGVDYLYLAGNHDETAHVFTDRDVPRNLKLFTTEWKSYRYDDVVISGIEMSPYNAMRIYQDIPHADGCINIVVLHGQVGTESGTDRVNLRLLQNQGIDYLALGHLHTYTVQKLDDQGIYCYSGCLEGRGFDECGPKGFAFLDIEAGKVHPQFVPFASRQLHQETIDITGLTKNSEITAKMRSFTGQIRREDMVEFVLTGHREPTMDIALSYLQNLLRKDYYFLQIKDETKIVINPKDYENDISLKGEFIRLVLAGNGSDEEKATMIRLGLEALAGEEIGL